MLYTFDRLVEYSTHLFRSLGFSHAGTEKATVFENHIMSNSSVFSLIGPVLAEFKNIEYYDHKDGDKKILGAGVISKKRRFRWHREVYQVPPNLLITHDFFPTMVEHNVFNEFPIGLVAAEPQRMQVDTLGEVVEDEFSKVIKLDVGEVRLYPVPELVPIITDGDLAVGN